MTLPWIPTCWPARSRNSSRGPAVNWLEVPCESVVFFCCKSLAMSSGRYYAFGPFRLDAVGGMLFRDHERLSLRPKLAEILTLLVEAEGNPVTKDELLQKVWAGAVVEE